MSVRDCGEQIYLDIGSSLRYQREQAGLSQTELSRAVGISQQNISRWEKGIHVPTIADCIRLANYYGITLDDLVGYAAEDN